MYHFLFSRLQDTILNINISQTNFDFQGLVFYLKSPTLDFMAPTWGGDGGPFFRNVVANQSSQQLAHKFGTTIENKQGYATQGQSFAAPSSIKKQPTTPPPKFVANPTQLTSPCNPQDPKSPLLEIPFVKLCATVDHME